MRKINKLKELRVLAGKNQRDIAKFLNVTEATVSNYENGKRDIPTENLKKLSAYFNVSTDYILGTSIEKNKKNNNFQNIPIIGKISAGQPILATENIEGYLPIDPQIYGFNTTTDLFFLRVSGQSMNLKVKNGDYVLVHKQNYADNDDIIVALVNDDNEATLKKYIKLNNEYVLLQPMSSDTSIQPITIDLQKDKFEIIGKAIGQFGKF